MEIKTIEKIPDEVYKRISTFSNMTIYHTKEWHQFLEKTFGWRVKAVVGYENQIPVLFLPFVRKLRLNFKVYNICLPFSHKAGLAYAEGYQTRFDDFFSILNRTFDNFEIHDDIDSAALKKKTTHSIVLLNLENIEEVEVLFKKFNKDSIQRKIKKAMKSGIVVKQKFSPADFDIFYNMMVDTRLNQGVPVYPRSFFKNLYRFFIETDQIKLYLAYYNQEPVAGIVFFHFNNSAIYAYGASKKESDYLKLGVNQLVMGEAIKEAFHQHAKFVDFGTTPVHHGSLLKYKLKWGGDDSPLPYSYLGHLNPVTREGKLTLLVASVLKALPRPIYKIASPFLLKIAV